MEKHPEEGELFAKFARTFSDAKALDNPPTIAKAYGWAKAGQGKIVDVGGGIGHIAIAIAQASPKINILIQDLECNAQEANKAIMEAGLSSRLKFEIHNFWEPQTEAGRHADIYFMRNIMLDFPDPQCQRILKHLVDAMKPKSRILICDTAPDSPTGFTKTEEARLRSVDLTILVLVGGKVRGLHDWEKLFKGADERLTITKVIGKPAMKRDSLIEIMLR
jgi:ubiquinone/menaquinone biosynthesis C-methylase UbiE